MQEEKLAGVRAQRASLRQAFTATEQALAAPMSGRSEQWHAQLAACLEQLHVAWDRHVVVTEGAGGLFAQVQADAPRLAPKVRRLRSEHERISSELDSLRSDLADGETADEMSTVRSQATAALSDIMRHRQSGADLVYEAYEVDIGGE